MKLVDRDFLGESIAQGVLYLINMQNYDGSISHNRSLWNIWETILAARVILCSSSLFDNDLSAVVEKAIEFLDSCEDKYGMVFHEKLASPELIAPITAKERFELGKLFYLNKEDIDFTLGVDVNNTPNLGQYGLFCTETSAEYLKLLSLLGAKADEKISNKLAFIKTLQESSGAWSGYSLLSEFDRLYPSVTGFVMQAFFANQSSPADPEKALNYIVQKQKTVGHWGADPYFLGTPFYAMNPVLSVLAHANHQNKYQETLRRANECLLALQKEDGSWYYQLQGWTVFHTLSPELQTGLALKCCYHLNMDINDLPVQKAISFLLNKQLYDGSWYGGFYPIPPMLKLHKPEPLYATTHILQALLCFYNERKDSLYSLVC